MSTEKTFTDFIVLHEKNIMSNGVKSIEKDIKAITERASAIIDDDSELEPAKIKLSEGIKVFKKILNKHNLFEI